MPTSTSNTLSYVLAIIGGILLLVILAGAFLLAWHKSISGSDALGIALAVLGLAGGALGVHTGVSAGAKAAKAPPTS